MKNNPVIFSRWRKIKKYISVILFVLVLIPAAFAQTDSGKANKSIYVSANGGVYTKSLMPPNSSLDNVIQANNAFSGGISAELLFRGTGIGLILTTNYIFWRDSGSNVYSYYQTVHGVHTTDKIYNLMAGIASAEKLGKHIILQYEIQGGIAYCFMPVQSTSPKLVQVTAYSSGSGFYGYSSMESFNTSSVKATAFDINLGAEMIILLCKRLLATLNAGFNGAVFNYTVYPYTSDDYDVSFYTSPYYGSNTTYTYNNPPVIKNDPSSSIKLGALCFYFSVGIGYKLGK